MAAINSSLLEAECGTTNPLIKLSQFYTRDNTLVSQDGILKSNANLNGSIGAPVDDLVNEYYLPEHLHRPLPAPTTFHLEELLSGLRVNDLSDHHHHQEPQAAKQEYEWTRQYLESYPDLAYTTRAAAGGSLPLSNGAAAGPSGVNLFPSSSAAFAAVGSNSSNLNNNSSSVIHPPHHHSTSSSSSSSRPFSIAQAQQQPHDFASLHHVQQQWMPQHYWNEQAYTPPTSSFLLNVNSNFLDQSSHLANAALSTTVDTATLSSSSAFDSNTIKSAQDLLAFLQEQETQFGDTDFKKFIENVAANEAAAEQQESAAQESTVNKWIDEFTVEQEAASKQSWNENEWQQDWTSGDQIPHSQSWLEDFMHSVDPYREYKFANANQFIDHTDPFKEGLKRLQEHDIVNAVLLFEAAAQKQPDHVDSWLYLGITQSENEQDAQAICALKKCIELDPKNLQAYITLASCYANEILTNEALDSLRKWLANNDKYAFLAAAAAATTVRSTSGATTTDILSSEDPKMVDELAFEELQELLLQAVSSSHSPSEIDSDLQVCLGILFHLSGDYDKAAECFNTAVSAKPDDALLWNKLGAALANGGQSDKAVDAYFHALSLSPGFVRARYNLGISCINLSAYKQAVEHFLTALKQQSDGIGPQGQHVQMSENIWRTLGIAMGHLQRPDLEQSVTSKDLSRLLSEFEIE